MGVLRALLRLAGGDGEGGCIGTAVHRRRGGGEDTPPLDPPHPPPPPPLPMFEADSQNFASAPSVPRGFTLSSPPLPPGLPPPLVGSTLQRACIHLATGVTQPLGRHCPTGAASKTLHFHRHHNRNNQRAPACAPCNPHPAEHTARNPVAGSTMRYQVTRKPAQEALSTVRCPSVAVRG